VRQQRLNQIQVHRLLVQPRQAAVRTVAVRQVQVGVVVRIQRHGRHGRRLLVAPAGAQQRLALGVAARGAPRAGGGGAAAAAQSGRGVRRQQVARRLDGVLKKKVLHGEGAAVRRQRGRAAEIARKELRIQRRRHQDDLLGV
jgi:hypothetical protein